MQRAEECEYLLSVGEGRERAFVLKKREFISRKGALFSWKRKFTIIYK
jgi:hypothetical protein